MPLRTIVRQAISAALVVAAVVLSTVASAQNLAVLVRDIAPGTASTSPDFVADLNGRLIFGLSPGRGGVVGEGLWRSDGTAAGTTLVRAGLSFPYSEAIAVNGVVLVTASDASGQAVLWRTDGTAAGTFPLSAFTPENRPMARVGSHAYFSASTTRELWRTDGTAAGTSLVRAFSQAEGRVVNLMPASTFLYFETGDPYDGSTLWRTDGTAVGTSALRAFRDDGNMVAQSRRTRFTGRHLRDALAIGDRLYFSHYTTAHGLELWTSDGTPASTVEVVDLDSGTPSSNPTSFEALAGVMTFTSGPYLWRSDGTAVGTTIVHPTLLVGETAAAGGNVYFNSHGGHADGFGLYKYDGIQVARLSPTFFDFFTTSGRSYAIVGDYLYASASGAVWRTDGTSTGTVLVGETYAGNTSGRSLIEVGGALFFWANHPSYGLEPWRIGTPTVLPQTVGDAYSTSPGVTLAVPAPGVLANDLANGGGALAAVMAAAPQHGALSLGADGAFTYVPAGGFTGLDSFSYRVTNTNGTSSPATVTITVAALTAQPPTALTVASVTGNVVTLQWTPAAGGPATTSYVMDGGVAPGQVLASIPTGSAAPSFTFTAPTGIFYLRMRALAGGQSSAASNEVIAYVNVPAPPSAPANLLGMSSGSLLGLSWRNTFAGGVPLNVVLDVSGAINASLSLGMTDTFAFNGVPPGNYTFTLRAQNSGGISGPSNAVSLSFPSACSGAPQTPENFQASALGGVVTLAWTPPATGTAVASYLLTVTGAFNGVLPLAATTISAPVPAGTYNLRVSAVNACGTSPATAVRTVVVGAAR